MITLTEAQINTALQYMLHLQEQGPKSRFSLTTAAQDKKDADRKAQLQKQIQARQATSAQKAKWGPAVPGLTGTFSVPITNSTTRGEYLATIIYQSKGWFADNEKNATRAILAINNKKIFEETQQALKKKTNGRGIAEYISSFFGDYDKIYVEYLKTFSATKQLTKYTAGGAMQFVLERLAKRENWKSSLRLSSIIKHLQNIGAWPSTLSILQKTYNYIKTIAELENKIWNSSIEKQAQDFWNTYYHEILLVVEIIVSFITPWGWLISMGVGLLNSSLYASEGQYYQAGVGAIFSIMPGVFKLAGKVPQLVGLMTKLGEKGMAKLGAKIASRSTKYSAIEQQVLKGLIGAKNFIKPLFNEAGKIQARRVALKAAAKMKGTQTAVAGFGKLTAKDKIAIFVANGVITLADVGIMLKKQQIANDYVTEQIWDKIYVQYIQNTEIERAGSKEILEYWKQQNPGKDPMKFHGKN